MIARARMADLFLNQTAVPVGEAPSMFWPRACEGLPFGRITTPATTFERPLAGKRKPQSSQRS
jgi:hypothetical protein